MSYAEFILDDMLEVDDMSEVADVEFEEAQARSAIAIDQSSERALRWECPVCQERPPKKYSRLNTTRVKKGEANLKVHLVVHKFEALRRGIITDAIKTEERTMRRKCDEEFDMIMLRILFQEYRERLLILHRQFVGEVKKECSEIVARGVEEKREQVTIELLEVMLVTQDFEEMFRLQIEEEQRRIRLMLECSSSRIFSYTFVGSPTQDVPFAVACPFDHSRLLCSFPSSTGAMTIARLENNCRLTTMRSHFERRFHLLASRMAEDDRELEQTNHPECFLPRGINMFSIESLLRDEDMEDEKSYLPVARQNLFDARGGATAGTGMTSAGHLFLDTLKGNNNNNNGANTNSNNNNNHHHHPTAGRTDDDATTPLPPSSSSPLQQSGHDILTPHSATERTYRLERALFLQARMLLRKKMAQIEENELVHRQRLHAAEHERRVRLDASRSNLYGVDKRLASSRKNPRLSAAIFQLSRGEEQQRSNLVEMERLARQRLDKLHEEVVDAFAAKTRGGSSACAAGLTTPRRASNVHHQHQHSHHRRKSHHHNQHLHHRRSIFSLRSDDDDDSGNNEDSSDGGAGGAENLRHTQQQQQQHRSQELPRKRFSSFYADASFTPAAESRKKFSVFSAAADHQDTSMPSSCAAASMLLLTPAQQAALEAEEKERQKQRDLEEMTTIYGNPFQEIEDQAIFMQALMQRHKAELQAKMARLGGLLQHLHDRHYRRDSAADGRVHRNWRTGTANPASSSSTAGGRRVTVFESPTPPPASSATKLHQMRYGQTDISGGEEDTSATTTRINAASHVGYSTPPPPSLLRRFSRADQHQSHSTAAPAAPAARGFLTPTPPASTPSGVRSSGGGASARRRSTLR